MLKISGKKKLSKNAGVTLLEILVVLAIITLLAALVGPRLMNQLGKAKSQAAKLQINNLNSALQLYYIDIGRFPSESEGLMALNSAPPGAQLWAGPYLKSDDAMNDPWNRPYLYEPSDSSVMLTSLGRDGQIGGVGEDTDIQN